MNHFISKGDIVVVKPNIGWDRAPQYAANSNPDLVAEIIKACYAAVPKRLKYSIKAVTMPGAVTKIRKSKKKLRQLMRGVSGPG